jgi:hypothetical protein
MTAVLFEEVSVATEAPSESFGASHGWRRQITDLLITPAGAGDTEVITAPDGSCSLFIM